MGEHARAPIEMPYSGEAASYGQFCDLVAVLEAHGAVVGASDTGYGVFAVATDREAVSVVKDLTGRRDDPLPAVVGSVRQAASTIEMREFHRGFLSAAWPGAFTAVSRTTRRARFIQDILNPKGGTLGVRVTTGTLESRFSVELDVPMVSTAVRRSDGSIVRNAVEARKIISDAMTLRQTPDQKVAFTANDSFRYSTHSTVGELVFADELIRIIREGVFTQAQILDLIQTLRRSYLNPENIEGIT